MQSLVEVHYYEKGGAEIGGPVVVNQLTSHPDLTDAWETIEDAVRLAYHVFTFNWGSVVDDAQRFYRDALKEENQYAKATTEVAWLEGGGVAGIDGTVEEVRVLFRAWSEDDLQNCDARVDHSNPSANVNQLGERRYAKNDNNFYESLWSVPLATIPAGLLVFNFAGGDDGWFFDVGHASMVSAKVIYPFVAEPDTIRSLRLVGAAKTEKARKSKELTVVAGSLLAAGE